MNATATIKAEQVLLAILDAKSTAVDDIRAALDELQCASSAAAPRRHNGDPPDDSLRVAAQAVVDGMDAWNKEFAADDGGDPEFDWIADPIERLRVVLAGIVS